MPEGDTIFRTASRLREALDGKKVQQAESRDSTFKVSSLVGQTITATEARGKHLLIHVDQGQVIHSHMGMTGAWHLYRPGEAWRKAESKAVITIDVGDQVCVCFSPKLIELLTDAELKRHRYLSRLGPDLLSERFCISDAIRRFRVHDRSSIGEAIMNQTIVCGVGNVYKSEVLFLTRTDPFALVGTFSDGELQSILARSRQLMMRNRIGQPRRTRFGRDGQRLWVYGRSRKPCLRCGVSVQMRRQGDLGRSTYWCPKCQ